ncbi:Branched-chain amino acid transport system 2 carrier protein [Serratia symbiotica]|nr:Branched-chain amino acid transport system 2 carrier protein [Serratia symbiotica]
MYHLKLKDIFTLSFMTFALFVGAGNIILPTIVGLQSGQNIWISALGFLITSVGLPIIALIALARANGSIKKLCIPIGKHGSLILSIICYLLIGPLFATPRTASISFEISIIPFINNNIISLFIYNVIYFILVISISLYPNYLINTIGYILAPLKIIGLGILGISALLWPAGEPIIATKIYQDMAFSSGFINGYLTMDTLGALVFGLVIINTARSRGITTHNILLHNITLSGCIAGIGLILFYLSLFKLGFNSGQLIPNPSNGAEILYIYVKNTFGNLGCIFLSGLIFIACIVTAIGLTCSCADFFTQYLPFSYKKIVFIFSIFSMLISNLSLNYLIQIFTPILVSIYPSCIVLILLSFTLHWWNNSKYVIKIAVLISLIFGIIDAIKISPLKHLLPIWMNYIPLYKQNLTWIIPTIFYLFLIIIYDQKFFFKK